MGIGVKLNETCECFHMPYDKLLTHKELGMDAMYAQVSVLICPLCRQHWLRYHYELEAFTASGRWFLGAITEQQAARADAHNAKATLEGLGWYFYGGSYYEGRSGRISGPLDV